MEFKTTTLGEYLPFIYGKALKSTNRTDGEVPVYGSNGIVGIHNEALVNRPGIIIGRKGSVGEVCISAVPFWAIDTTFYAIKDDLDELFFSYYLLKQLELTKMNSDSAVPGLNRENAHQITINIPKDFKDRKSIGRAIRLYDQKIDNCRAIIKLIESISQTIFNSWFKDFDPVRAKVAAKASGIDTQLAAIQAISGKSPAEIEQLLQKQYQKLAATADSFPEELVKSDEGEIPMGWEWKALYDTAEYVNGSVFKSSDFSSERDGFPIVKIAELKSGITSQTKFTAKAIAEKYAIDNGALLYSWSGSPETSLEVFKWFGGKGWLNQHIFLINTDSDVKKAYIYNLLKYLKPELINIAKNKQTTGLGHVTVADMKRLRVPYPDQDGFELIEDYLLPLYDMDSNYTLQIEYLRQQRDALIPKLLSGKLQVN
ncbi:restriction endonuclease subunit S [Pontibacter oryzae]|uniref:Restriction endonuclease subunit S n=1 Tax=Pontibacter oryzae TaxID=2304593 RepID=A0A399SHD6_9BACT|nr:restriction endonuclease subunit S [Pontibacter oryzae]RIJ42658.1 restriction endonuclease subunit S [Pontibacter oryzae]